jgi:N-hydroxyarylamine O-acetyltransferase
VVGAGTARPRRAPVHQAYFAQAWHDVYDFTLEPMAAIDREVANWFTSAHPASHFRGRLMVARATPHGRITLQDRELRLRTPDGGAESKTLASAHELLATLAEQFGLHFPAGTRFTCPALDDLT